MKYKNCSAIYLFSGRAAALMDCAEGTYGQIVDYCGDWEKVDAVVLKTRFVYITHLHGDHTLGLPRFIHERDKILSKLDEDERTKLYVLAPQCMLEWIENSVSRLKNPNFVKVLPHNILNPEKYYMYQ